MGQGKCAGLRSVRSVLAFLALDVCSSGTWDFGTLVAVVVAVVGVGKGAPVAAAVEVVQGNKSGLDKRTWAGTQPTSDKSTDGRL